MPNIDGKVARSGTVRILTNNKNVIDKSMALFKHWSNIDVRWTQWHLRD